jgi:hypothetical protein
MLMDSRKGLKIGDARLVDADRLLEVMRSKATRAREGNGRIRTKRDEMVHNATVDAVVAADMHADIQEELVKGIAANASQGRRLEGLQERLALQNATSQRAVRTVLEVAGGGVDLDQPAGRVEEDAPFAESPSAASKRARAESVRARPAKRAKVALAKCEVKLSSGKNKGSPCGSTANCRHRKVVAVIEAPDPGQQTLAFSQPRVERQPTAPSAERVEEKADEEDDYYSDEDVGTAEAPALAQQSKSPEVGVVPEDGGEPEAAADVEGQKVLDVVEEVVTGDVVEEVVTGDVADEPLL